jgi:hypothetical protein
MCMDQAAVPVKRVWLGLATRLGLRRKTGKLSTSDRVLGVARGGVAAAFCPLLFCRPQLVSDRRIG